MAQNISLWGASYSDVPAVDLPKTGGGTATFLDTEVPRGTNAIAADKVLNGYHGFVNGAEVVGSITSQGAQTITPGTTDQTIASGKYLSGTQTILGDADLVSANIKAGKNIFGVQGDTNVVDTTIDPDYDIDFPITAADVRINRAGFVNGSRIDGTMASKSAATYTPGTTDQTISSGQYLSGAQTIKGDADLVAGNIKSGVEIFGVTGSYIGSGLATAVTGTFTPGTAGDVESVTISYNGSGFPIMCAVFPAAGSYKSDSTIYNSLQRYAVVEWFMTKASTTATPTYTTSGGVNYGCTAWVYKNSTSSATSYSRSSAMNTNTFTSDDPTNAGATCVRFTGNKTLKYFVASSSYGLLSGTEYRYVILYSA